jgi:hypothetical protein
MKTQTAEETLEQAGDRELSYIHDACAKNIDFVLGFRTGFLLGSNWQEQKTTTQIEALRERLKEGIEIKFEDNYNGSLGDENGRLYTRKAIVDFDSIDQVINHFLKELSDAKR